jgi:hypothetical protein
MKRCGLFGSRAIGNIAAPRSIRPARLALRIFDDEQLMNEDHNLVHQDEPRAISNVVFNAERAIALRGDFAPTRLNLLESDQLQVWRLRLCNV